MDPPAKSPQRLGEGGLHASFGPELADESDPSAVDTYSPDGVDRRNEVLRQIRERRGQTLFRNALRQRYGDRCLVTGCKILAIIEAAHIRPYRRELDNHAENGLLLRSDIHTLFDLDLLGIDPEHLTVKLHPAISKEYSGVEGSKLKVEGSFRPSTEALRHRYESFRCRLQLPA